VKGLNSATLYYIRVRANNIRVQVIGLFNSTMTNEASVAPLLLTGSRVSSSEVGYSWNAVPGAKSYIVELAQISTLCKA